MEIPEGPDQEGFPLSRSDEWIEVSNSTHLVNPFNALPAPMMMPLTDESQHESYPYNSSNYWTSSTSEAMPPLSHEPSTTFSQSSVFSLPPSRNLSTEYPFGIDRGDQPNQLSSNRKGSETQKLCYRPEKRRRTLESSHGRSVECEDTRPARKKPHVHRSRKSRGSYPHGGRNLIDDEVQHIKHYGVSAVQLSNLKDYLTANIQSNVQISQAQSSGLGQDHLKCSRALEPDKLIAGEGIDDGKKISEAHIHRKLLSQLQMFQSPGKKVSENRRGDWYCISDLHCPFRASTKASWKRHNEMHWPQRVWICRIGNCVKGCFRGCFGATVFTRQFQYNRHITTDHNSSASQAEVAVQSKKNPLNIEGSKFNRHCEYDGCFDLFESLDDKLEHCAHHIARKHHLSNTGAANIASDPVWSERRKPGGSTMSTQGSGDGVNIGSIPRHSWSKHQGNENVQHNQRIGQTLEADDESEYDSDTSSSSESSQGESEDDSGSDSDDDWDNHDSGASGPSGSSFNPNIDKTSYNSSSAFAPASETSHYGNGTNYNYRTQSDNSRLTDDSAKDAPGEKQSTTNVPVSSACDSPEERPDRSIQCASNSADKPTKASIQKCDPRTQDTDKESLELQCDVATEGIESSLALVNPSVTTRSNAPETLRNNAPIQDFNDALNKYTCKAFDGRTFVLREKLIGWLASVSQVNGEGDQIPQIERLRRFVYRQRTHPAIPISTEVLLRDVPLTFSILLTLDCGQLIHEFQRQNIVDCSLDLESEVLRGRIGRIEAKHSSDLEEHFNTLRWHYAPVVLDLGMDKNFCGRDLILPFSNMEQIGKGGTASVWKIEVPEDYVRDTLKKKVSSVVSRPDDYGKWYTFALKKFRVKHAQEYRTEREAYQALGDHPGIIQYLGSFSLELKNIIGYGLDRPDNADQENFTHNILLEYADGGDLEQYFQTNQVPVDTKESHALWRNFYSVARALEALHKLEYFHDDLPLDFNGIHQDLKPSNILVVNGNFKLADFGFSDFVISDFGISEIARMTDSCGPNLAAKQIRIKGGTRTYGAPELFAPDVPPMLSAKSDVWSFGCVISEVVTWVLTGASGLETFSWERSKAIQMIRGTSDLWKETGGHHIPKRRIQRFPERGFARWRIASNSFHSDHQVLPAVTLWHDKLRSNRKLDPLTSRILDMVDNQMLLVDPSTRISSQELCRQLALILEENLEAPYRQAKDRRSFGSKGQPLVSQIQVPYWTFKVGAKNQRRRVIDHYPST